MSIKAFRRLCAPLATSILIIMLSIRAAVAQDDAAATAFVCIFLFFCLLAALVFFIPSIVAFARGHPNRWLILVVNLVFGATGLGWLGSLVWACNAAHRSNYGSDGGESGLNFFVNDVQRIAIQEHARLPIEELRRLNILFDEGALDPREYQHLKSRLLQRE